MLNSNRLEVIFPHQGMVRSSKDGLPAVLISTRIRDCCLVNGIIKDKLVFMVHFTWYQLGNINDARKETKKMLDTIEDKLQSFFLQNTELSIQEIKKIVQKEMEDLKFTITTKITEKEQRLDIFETNNKKRKIIFHSNNFANLKQSLQENGVKAENIEIDIKSIDEIRRTGKDIDAILNISENKLILMEADLQAENSAIFSMENKYEFCKQEFASRLAMSDEITALKQEEDVFTYKLDSEKNLHLEGKYSGEFNIGIHYL